MAAYAAVVTLKQSLLEITHEGGIWMSKYHPSLMEIIQFLVRELKSIQEFVERLDMKGRMRMKYQLERIAEATIQFKDRLQNFIKNSLDQPEVMLDQSDIDADMYCEETDDTKVSAYLQDLRQAVHCFVDTLKKVHEEYLKGQDEDVVHVDSGGKVIGLSDVYGELKRVVVSPKVDESIVLFVGMVGIGKTTLATKLFEDLDVLEWFDYRAWVTVGMKFQPDEIAKAILAQTGHDIISSIAIPAQTDHDISDSAKRYLIVLDDVWDIDLSSSYIDDTLNIRNGIKVLLTTTVQDGCTDSKLITSRLLDKQESWLLLCDKIFAQNPCPSELEEVGKMIAEKCDGLPLTIVTVANLLSNIPQSLWIQVATQKKHQLFIDAYDEISKLLYPRYANLPNDLKLCFLYMGVFPQNSKILKTKLINLWIVEKIIEKTSKLSGVEVLQSLALHSFVMVFQRSTIMNDEDKEIIKCCGLHSSWWHFCHREARKNKIFHILDSYTDASEEIIKNQTRLTVHNNILFGIKVVNKSMEENCAFTTHSLLCFGPYHKYPVTICFGLKLLKKLDALQIRFYQFPLEVLELVKLRYLALTCNTSLPPSISKLLKLQYLIVHHHLSMKYGDLSYLPVEIWDMKRLKYLHVTDNNLPDVDGTLLLNLLTLKGVSFNSCINGVVKRMPNLKKLGIQIDLMPSEVEPSYCFDTISHLSELESLKCEIVNPTCNLKVVAPLVPRLMLSVSLKKLNLSGLGFPWEEASTISSLPNLEVLKLRNNAFQGPKWEIEDHAFPKLRCLIMEDIDLVILIGGYESFNCLEKISIKHCYKLKKFCLSHGYECVPNSCEVIDCNPLVGREIQKSILLGYSDCTPDYLSIQSSWITRT